MTKRMSKYLLLISLLFLSMSMSAQKGLQINEIMNEYGKQEGSILIELAKDVLGKHTKINKYKSLIMESKSEVVLQALHAIEQDMDGGSKLMESKKDGQVESGYYCLPRKSESDPYEYILFKNKANKLNLVYVRGSFPPQDLEKELSKLKDLFIKVNNKQIKLTTL